MGDETYGDGAYGDGHYGGFGSMTRLVYDGLPELYRTADAPERLLLRWLDGLLHQLQPVRALIDRFRYVPADDPDPDPAATTSALVDPAAAEARWLPWLGQLLGIKLPEEVPAQRAVLGDAEVAWRHGNAMAIAQEARRGLTGAREVKLVAHHGGDPWTIGVGTVDAEATPADTFAELMAIAPTWGHLQRIGSPANAAAPAPMGYADGERPAGYRLTRFPITSGQGVPG